MSSPRSPSLSPHAPQPLELGSRPDIRIVPYTPTRIKEDHASLHTSRPVSYMDADEPSSPPSSPPSLPNIDVYEWDSTPVSPARPKARLRHYSSLTSHASTVRSGHDNDSSPGPADTQRSASSRRPKKIIDINVSSDNKTFSLHSQTITGSMSSRADSFPLSQTTPSSSYGRNSSFSWFDESGNALQFPAQQSSQQPLLFVSSSPSSNVLRYSSPPSSSQLGRYEYDRQRRANQTPGPKGKQALYSPGSSPPELRPEDRTWRPASSQKLAGKASLLSSQSESNLSESNSYETFGQRSPVVPQYPPRSHRLGPQREPPSSSHTQNYYILGESSGSDVSGEEQAPVSSSDFDSETNYVVHGDTSVSASSPVTSKTLPVHSEYSRESLVVAPLRTVRRRRSSDRLSLSKSSSRESLRSLTSLSNFLTQEATRSLFMGSVDLPWPSIPARQQSRAPSSRSASANAYLHGYSQPWTTQLSTVMSESEPADTVSRNFSAFSETGRQTSGSSNLSSKHILGMSTSTQEMDHAPNGITHCCNTPLDTPQPAYTRGLVKGNGHGNIRLIKDHDEDGDGLAELDELQRHGFRTRLGGNLSSQSSSQSLRRINSLRSSLPPWARLYYGSGEPRSLVPQPSMESLMSEFAGRGNGAPSHLNGSPSTERYVTAIHNPRRRPREEANAAPSSRQSRRSWLSGYTRMSRRSHSQLRGNAAHQDDDIRQNRILGAVRTIKRRTSSAWSPHLHPDKRASDYSLWDPPPAILSTDGGIMGRRNLQIILFFTGFLCPFAWMIAAVLPLPEDLGHEMSEPLQSSSHIDVQEQTSLQARKVQRSRYHGAKWWRTLNRGMSFIGLVIIAAAISLIVVGVKQQWTGGR